MFYNKLKKQVLKVIGYEARKKQKTKNKNKNKKTHDEYKVHESQGNGT